jgi:putative FmdB family regulatory protein
MPIYDRQCTPCETNFEVNCRIADKDNVHPCPNCGSDVGEWRPSAPFTSMYPERYMTKKKDAGFKEVLQKIQSRNKNTSVSEQ